MSQIKITPQELYDGANDIQNLAQEVSGNLERLREIVNAVADNWEGAARTTYVESFNELFTQFKEAFPPSIEGLAEQMKAAAEALEGTDEEIAKAFSSR